MKRLIALFRMMRQGDGPFFMDLNGPDHSPISFECRNASNFSRYNLLTKFR